MTHCGPPRAPRPSRRQRTCGEPAGPWGQWAVGHCIGIIMSSPRKWTCRMLWDHRDHKAAWPWQGALHVSSKDGGQVGPCKSIRPVYMLTAAQGASCSLQGLGTPWHMDLLPPYSGQTSHAWESQPHRAPAQRPCRYPRGTALTATEPAVLGHQLLVGRESACLLGTGGEDKGVSECRLPRRTRSGASHE